MAILKDDTAVSAAAGVLGRMTSPKKAAGARRNGRLGGAPPKYQPGDLVSIRAGAPIRLVGCLGTITAYLGPTRYRVLVSGLEDHDLRSWWLRGFRRGGSKTKKDL